VRTQTQTLVGAIGLGVLGVSYIVGAQAATNSIPIADVAAVSHSTASAAPSATATPATSKKPTTKKKKKATGSSSSSTSTGSSGTTSASGTKSADVSYQYGSFTLAVTQKNGQITNVDFGNCDQVRTCATDGRNVVFPSLAQAAIDANGASFGSISGATYTSNAFKKALKAALAKF